MFTWQASHVDETLPPKIPGQDPTPSAVPNSQPRGPAKPNVGLEPTTTTDKDPPDFISPHPSGSRFTPLNAIAV
ncbi:hypothetical protein TSMEX_011536 [Taenia solium]|eukprot:TsM_000475300 transcript=TsM_000475300 gene=TsM_000475300